MAHPASGRTVPADVGKGLVVVTVRSAEGHLLNGLVHDEVLGDGQRRVESGTKIRNLSPAGTRHWLDPAFTSTISEPLAPPRYEEPFQPLSASLVSTREARRKGRGPPPSLCTFRGPASPL